MQLHLIQNGLHHSLKEGNAYYELGNYTLAIESYDKAFVILGNIDEQVKSLNKNTGPKPYWLNIWFDKGEALTKLKNSMMQCLYTIN